MLRFIGIIVALLYMTVTSGIVINIHYCMGEEQSVAVGAPSDARCGTCGMDGGCCHDELQVVKLQDSHHPAAGIPSPNKPLAQLHKHDAMDQQNEIPARWVGSSKVHTPPKAFDRNIHYRVFRI